MLRLYNTMTRRKEPFEPADGLTARVYTCGPTVYDVPHIGNYRAFVFEDLLCRYLRYKGWAVHQVMNLTDVDDKTIRGAQERGVSLDKYTQPYIEAFFEDLRRLRVEPAWKYPRATEHIPEMLEIAQALVDQGYAYVVEGNVYFSLQRFPHYGRLSGVHLGDGSARQAAFGRLEEDEYDKEDVRDFALWKATKPGEPAWDSPWGPGRPGWHIECSAMSMKYLGRTLDIHTGGVDNLFPHHENEIAQSEAYTGEPFSRFWMHGEHLLVNGEKMSKSLGNFHTLRDLLEQGWDPVVVRHQYLTTHYRKQHNFTVEGLAQSKQAVAKLHDFADRVAEAPGRDADDALLREQVAQARDRFESAMDDDLNAPGAMGHVYELAGAVNVALVERQVSRETLDAVAQFLERADTVLGIIAHETLSLDDGIEALIRERIEARARKDFARADEIRDGLAAQGIVLEDGLEGTRWRRTN